MMQSRLIICSSCHNKHTYKIKYKLVTCKLSYYIFHRWKLILSKFILFYFSFSAEASLISCNYFIFTCLSYYPLSLNLKG